MTTTAPTAEPIEYFTENRNTVLAANRVQAGDRVIRTITGDGPGGLREWLLGALPVSRGRVRTTCRPCWRAGRCSSRLCLDRLPDEDP
ncbi:hypothetical protein [Streptomyces sp. Wb2n-11]|uniref:hypothetical protein n=1 Tax=Streptomyces sp. Wb2n-11 TaxID=1030533 RepID=UPI000A6F486A|nr:hypothetical protein [Streptomyces sp. Wb2n-11]